MKALIFVLMVAGCGLNHKEEASIKGEMAAHAIELNRLNKLEGRILRHTNFYFYTLSRTGGLSFMRCDEVYIDEQKGNFYYGRMILTGIAGGKMVTSMLEFGIELNGHEWGPPDLKEMK